MKQKQYSPLSVAEMGLSLYAVNEGYLDKVAGRESHRTSRRRCTTTRARITRTSLDKINESGDYSEASGGLKRSAKRSPRKALYSMAVDY